MKPALALLLAACGAGHVHAFRFDASVPAQQQEWVEYAAAEVNAHLGCEAIRINSTATHAIVVFDKYDPSALGDFDLWGSGDVHMLNIVTHPQQNRDGGADASATYAMRLAVHEFGHALGKEDHSADVWDLMYADDYEACKEVTDDEWSRYAEQIRTANPDVCNEVTAPR